MELLDHIADERRRSADLFDSLSPAELVTPSLCAAWTVSDLAAHLLMPLVTPLRIIVVTMLRSAGNFDRTNIALTARPARRGIPEIADLLRANARHPFHPPGFGHEAPLTDLLIHGQDIRRPLGLAYTADEKRLVTALRLLTSKPAVTGFVRRGTRDGLRFEATDVDWSYGDGELVTGSANALLLGLTGRPSGLDELEGDGVATLRQRVG